MTSQVVAIAALLAASSFASTSALAVGPAGRDYGVLEVKRHGDADENGFGIHSAAATSHGSHPHSEPADDPAAAPNPHSHDGHDGHDMHDMHDMHGASFYDVIPDPLLQTSATFIPVPALPVGAGGHSHGGHGAEEPKLELNETVIVRWKGPDPLSYIEWDFGYGVGKSDDLLRFSQAYKQGAANVMGVSGERWRTLVNERDEETRMQVASDVLHRVQESHQDPGRHGALLILHVVGCILSCFVALPIGAWCRGR